MVRREKILSLFMSLQGFECLDWSNYHSFKIQNFIFNHKKISDFEILAHQILAKKYFYIVRYHDYIKEHFSAI